MKKAISAASLLILCSCQSVYRPKPAVPSTVFSNPYVADLSQPTLFAAYDAMPEGPAKVARRNQILYELIYLTDQQYNSYEAAFFSDQAYAGIATDVAVEGLSAAGAVVGAAQIKSILAAVSGGVTGVNSSYQKNFFDQATRESIVQVMRSSRLAALATIRIGMTDGTGTYSLEQGLFDVADYYDAGTITGALVAISNSSSQQATAAREALKTLRGK